MKTYGQIAREAFNLANIGKSHPEFYEDVAQAVITEFKKREMVKGWRLLEPDEFIQAGDWYYVPKSLGHGEWKEWPNDITPRQAKHIQYPIRRRITADFHQQDKQPTSKGGVADAETLDATNNANDSDGPAPNGPIPNGASDTPRTDAANAAAQAFFWIEKVVPAELAISLELELAEANRRAESGKLAYSECAEQLAECKETLVRTISELATLKQSAPRWIPTAERLPTKEDFNGQPVFCTGSDGFDSIPEGACGWKFNPVPWTHWMPIPPLPKPTDPFDRWLDKHFGTGLRPNVEHLRAAWEAGKND